MLLMTPELFASKAKMHMSYHLEIHLKMSHLVLKMYEFLYLSLFLFLMCLSFSVKM